MPDRTYQTRSLSFDDDNISPVVLATTNRNEHCLLERLFSVNNVSAVSSSTKNSMSSIKTTKTNLSNGVPMARPFDEFSTDMTTIPTSPLDGQGSGLIIKSDKD